MVGILLSFWEGPFSGAMLVLGRVSLANVFFFCEAYAVLRGAEGELFELPGPMVFQKR